MDNQDSDNQIKKSNDRSGSGPPPLIGEPVVPTPHTLPGAESESRSQTSADSDFGSLRDTRKSGKKWLKTLIALIVIAALAAIGWLLYKEVTKQEQPSSSTSSVTQNKEIPLLKIGFLQADYGKLYPSISPNDYSISTNAQMFEGLVRYENRSKIVPNLASDWTNPDNKTWVFTIKDGVKFHDGHTMTAKDVKYSLDKIVASKSDYAGTFASTLKSVDVVGGNKVKIITDAPDPTLLNRLAFLFIIDANLPKGDEPSMAGTGPYRVKPDAKPTSKNIQMVAFDDYHGGRPVVRSVTFGSEDSSSNLVKAFKEHKYNIAGYTSDDGLKQVPDAEQFKTSSSDVYFVGLNSVKTGPLQNKKVREAIRYTVDAKAIGEARGTKNTPLSQMISPSIPGYNPAIPVYEQDIAKAKKLLADAGYPDGLTLHYTVSTDVPDTTAEVVKEFKAVGITLKLDEYKNFDDYVNAFIDGKAEMYTVDYSSDTLDGLDIYATTLPTTNYDNPKLTALFDQAATTVDPAKRLKLLQDAAVIVDQDVAVVPVSTEEDLWLMDKDYQITQDMPSAYLPVYLYKVQLK